MTSVTRLAWFATAMRERPADEDLVQSVLVALGSAPTDPQLMVEIARLRSELLSPERIERVFRDRQGAMATELRAILAERGSEPLAAAVGAEVVAGAVFAALTVWTEGAGPHDVRRLATLTADALEQVRPALLSARRSGPGSPDRTRRTSREGDLQAGEVQLDLPPWGTSHTAYEQKTASAGTTNDRASNQSSATIGMHQTQWWLQLIGEMSSPVTAAAGSRCHRGGGGQAPRRRARRPAPARRGPARGCRCRGCDRSDQPAADRLVERVLQAPGPVEVEEVASPERPRRAGSKAAPTATVAANIPIAVAAARNRPVSTR